jgi:hypothetical protein
LVGCLTTFGYVKPVYVITSALLSIAFYRESLLKAQSPFGNRRDDDRSNEGSGGRKIGIGANIQFYVD